MKALLLVGGLSTRLKEIAKETPKCMLDINGKPFLYYQFENLKKYGIKDIVLCVGHLKEKIEESFGDGSRYGVNIEYSKEKERLGTAGPIKLARRFIDGTFICMNGDCFTNVNFNELLKKHKNKVTLTIKKIHDCSDYGTVEINKEGKVLAFKEKEKKFNGFINAGVYVLEPETIDFIKDGEVSIEREVFPVMVKKGLIGSYEHEGDFIDIGVPERYKYFKRFVKDL